MKAQSRFGGAAAGAGSTALCAEWGGLVPKDPAPVEPPTAAHAVPSLSSILPSPKGALILFRGNF